jgi:uncharacterized protein YqhQ
VLEGVMMRSPQALAIAVRLPNGEVLLKDEPYSSLTARYPLLKRPFFRGPVILIEALVTGIRALSFSAQAALEEEETSLGWGSIALTMGGPFSWPFFSSAFCPTI